FLSPRHIAVIGATDAPQSVGRQALWNLLTHPFGGTVYPVNPNRASVLGVKAYPTVADVPAQVDVALICTPAASTPELVRQCVEAGVTGVVVFAAGFSEAGAEGARLEQQLRAALGDSQTRLLGPNGLGLIRPRTQLNATFARHLPPDGSVGFVSQSGALLTAVLDWSRRENVGFSTVLSLGTMLDIGWGEAITFLGDDPRTRSILLYLETIDDARALLSAAREVALQKPIIVVKASRRGPDDVALDDAVLDAAFRRTGVLRVPSIAGLFHAAEVLAKQTRPAGPRLTILTNAGGPGLLAADALVENGGTVATLSDAARSRLAEVLPAESTATNPIDLQHDATPQRYADALEAALHDEATDGVLTILTPQALTDPEAVAARLREQARSPKPLIASFMGADDVADATALLNDAGIPTFAYPDTAARVFGYLWRYSYNLRALYETPALPADEDGLPDREHAATLIGTALADGRTALDEVESKALLACYGFAAAMPTVAHTPDEAVTLAQPLLDAGGRVVVKLHTHTVSNRGAAGGVFLDLHTENEVREAFAQIEGIYVSDTAERADAVPPFAGVTVQPMIRQRGVELRLQATLDPVFGPVIRFGAGGSFAAVMQDAALGLPPLNTTLARRMMEQTRVYAALRDEAQHADLALGQVDLAAIEELVVRFAQLVAEQPRVHEIDLNPLLASAAGFTVLDARVRLHPATVSDEALPHPAIRPYPRHYVETYTLKNGSAVTIRPIRPEDEPEVVAFHQDLDEQSVYLRYAGTVKLSERIAHDRLARKCFIDYDREMALVAERDVDGRERPEIVGIGRLTRIPRTTEREYGMLVKDEFQGQGLGTELLRRLVQVGRDEGAERITADILRTNRGMQRASEKVGFTIVRPEEFDDPMVRAVLELG
ncbi:MAG: bifunctional acetate--CoA ligase family protein/GNAT family N-acetyltransferase, partial [Bacteroidota bacterium]